MSEVDYGDTPLQSREHVQLSDNKMYLWIQLIPSRLKRLNNQIRIIVTPVMRRCGHSNMWWTPCSGPGQVPGHNTGHNTGHNSGPCVRRDLVCDGVVNCGDLGDEGPHVCRTRVSQVEPAVTHWLLPLYIGIVVFSLLLTGSLLLFCKLLHSEKLMRSLSTSCVNVRDYPEASAPPLVTAPHINENPPSYDEAVMQSRFR